MLGWALSIAVVAGLAGVGLAAVYMPRVAARHYGIVPDDVRALAFIRGMGIRDVVIGVLLGLLALERAPTALGWGLVVTALVAVVDLAVVIADHRATSRRPMDRAAAVHAGGILVLLVAGVVLLVGR